MAGPQRFEMFQHRALKGPALLANCNTGGRWCAGPGKAVPIRGIEAYQLDALLDRWRALRQVIHSEVCEQGYDPRLNSFVQAYGSQELDASLLLLPTVGFLPASDPRIRGTIEAVERALLVDGFLLRYNTVTSHDGPKASAHFYPAASGLRMHTC